MTARITLVALLLILATAACAQSLLPPDLNDPVAGRRDGAAAAADAIAKGDLKILSHGGNMPPVDAPPPEPRTDKLTGLPVQSYGMGCQIDPYFDGYLQGFNERMRAHVAANGNKS